jgi:CRISPR system Cascade subunit CasC
MTMYIELHMLQNFAPSNLNRDDTNNPKDCEFGGVRRARISSQCLKHAIRWSPVFARDTQVDSSLRTRWIARKIMDEMVKQKKSDQEAAHLANEFAKAYAGKTEKPKDSQLERTAVLLYLSAEEIGAAARGLLQGTPVTDIVKGLVKQTEGRTSAPDIALFGRMLANDPKLNLDAACQVAHAISTHRVNMEMDFYTAVDDMQTDDETGAGMMGTVGFNSACFYRYACVDWEQLLKNLDGDKTLASRTLRAFLAASVSAIPSGKQNSFAAQNMPALLLAVVRKDGQCWSLANAFAQPVTPGREAGLVARSVQALEEHWTSLSRAYGGPGIVPVALAADPAVHLTSLEECATESLDAWLTAVTTAVDKG